MESSSWWSMEEVSRNVHQFRVDFRTLEAPRRFLWIADLHWDNPKCNRELLKTHLDEALEHDIPIIVVGDLFCAMQGKYDKRQNKDSIRPEHQHGDYLDQLVKTATDWFEPYKNNLAVVGHGNHESGIRRRHETCLIDRLCSGLRDRGGITRSGGYNGWIQHMFSSNTIRRSFNFYYAHGSGGGAPVTKGAINFNRWREQVTADAYIAGHIHRWNSNINTVASLNGKGQISHDQVDYIRCSTYKDDYEDGAHGWHNEGQMGPRPLGGWWCEWKYARRKGSSKTARPSWKRRWIPTDAE
jgi:hypothetical protein